LFSRETFFRDRVNDLLDALHISGVVFQAAYFTPLPHI
jgi:hypothetical protein